MSIFQLTAILFALFMMYIVSIHKRKSDLGLVEVSFWYSVWTLFIIISLFPNWLLGLAGVLNFTRVFDLLTVAALMVITLLVISNYLSQKELNQKIEQLVREKTILEKLARPTKRKRHGQT